MTANGFHESNGIYYLFSLSNYSRVLFLRIYAKVVELPLIFASSHSIWFWLKEHEKPSQGMDFSLSNYCYRLLRRSCCAWLTVESFGSDNIFWYTSGKVMQTITQYLIIGYLSKRKIILSVWSSKSCFMDFRLSCYTSIISWSLLSLNNCHL